MKKINIAIVVLLLLTGVARASEKILRAKDMANATWTDLTRGKLGDVVVEFRQGDELPINFEAQGDLIETKTSLVNYVVIKRNFWLRLTKNNLEISLDGTTFKNLSEALTGSIEAGAGSAQNGGVADGINIVFKTFLKFKEENL